MKSFLAFCLLVAPLCAQSLPNLPDETVVATFDDGAQMTYGEFKRIYSILPSENQQQALQNRAAFLQQWGLMRKLARIAESEKMDQLSPSKEAIEYYRYVILSQAQMSRAMTDIQVLPSQVSEQYEQTKDRYKQVKVKAIYIGFGGKETEQEAKAKALRLLAQARAGADFSKLARENSDDATSRAKDGDFATLRPSDNVPDAVREAIFQLKQGEITDPVRQPNGFYLFRAQEISVRPFHEVRDDIFNELKQQYYKEWLDKTKSGAAVVFNSPAFIGLTPNQLKVVPATPESDTPKK
jgi:parvulin-like peptidyl-prolyl isomerase